MAGAKSSSQLRRFFAGPEGPNWARIAIAAVALIYGVLFVVLNRTKVRVHFVFFTLTTRLWVSFLVCVALGLLLGQSAGALRRRSRKSSQPHRDEAA